MSRQVKFSILFFVLAIPLVLFATGILKLPKKTTPPSTSPNQALTPIPVADINTIPLKGNNPSVTYAAINYSFNGKVKNVAVSTKSTEVIVELTDGTEIVLPIKSSTQITRVSEAGSEKLSASDLRTGADVNVTADFNLKTGRWAPFNITLLSATPTRQP